jgi:hypothetical protein
MALTALFMLGYGAHLCQLTLVPDDGGIPGLAGARLPADPVAGLLTLLFLLERVWVGEPPRDVVMYSDQAAELE